MDALCDIIASSTEPFIHTALAPHAELKAIFELTIAASAGTNYSSVHSVHSATTRYRALWILKAPLLSRMYPASQTDS
jgi:hypothetical protein